jgi:NADPH-dependent curcumin reductase CurA
VYGTLGWQEYWVGQATKLERRTTPKGGRDVDHLGLFGVSGMTAYFGMFDIGRIKNGDNVVISGAAGSVGLIATQIALAYPKCRVTAIAGSASKLEALRKLGCHHTLNYKDKDFPGGWSESTIVRRGLRRWPVTDRLLDRSVNPNRPPAGGPPGRRPAWCEGPAM